MSRWVTRSGTAAEIGGKAAALASLEASGITIPPWFAIRTLPNDESSGVLSPDLVAEVRGAVGDLAPDGAPLAVRSSAVEEDSAGHSFAGQYESYLFVPPNDVPARVRDVWEAASSDRVNAYRRERGLSGDALRPAVLVQRMVNADVSGVAFSADPVTGRRGTCVIAATYGVGSALVSGDVNADSFKVSRGGEIVERQIAEKRTAHRQGPNGVVEAEVPDALASRPSLADDQVREVAALARA